MRVIVHVDLDDFFPSIEVRKHLELKGKAGNFWGCSKIRKRQRRR
ncbi:MAG: DNA polymerase IV [Methanosaeta sp. PtaU1.Bin112]|nr:MAG: DNA polymerase IV [Methanosaeta sp. PtaU1.Bin112]